MEATKTHVQNNMSKWVCLNMKCPFLTPKWLRWREKRSPHFQTYPNKTKKHVLQQWQWIVFGSAKPAQDEKPKTRRKMKPTNAKTTAQSNKSKNVKTIVQNLTCQLHRLWNSEEFMWIRGCSLLMGVHVCFSFCLAATHLAYSVGFHAQKEKSK